MRIEERVSGEALVRFREEIEVVAEQERRRLLAEGMDGGEVRARLDALRTGLGFLVNGVRVDPADVQVFARADVRLKPIHSVAVAAASGDTLVSSVEE